MIGENSQLTVSITSSNDSVLLHRNSKTSSVASINNNNNNNNIINRSNSNNNINNNSYDDVNNSNNNNNNNNINNKDNKYNSSSYSSNNNNSKKLVLKQHYYASSEASIPVILPITKSTPNIAPHNHHQQQHHNYNHQTIEIKPYKVNTNVTVNMNELIELDGFYILEVTGCEFPEDAHVVNLSDHKLSSTVEEDLLHFTELTLLDVSENFLQLNPFGIIPQLQDLRMACNRIRLIIHLSSLID